MRNQPAVPSWPARRCVGVVAAALAIVALGGGAATTAPVGSIEGVVTTPEGTPVPDAVISAVVLSGPRPAAQPGRVVVDQQDKEFVPHVRAVLVGTEVVFPNKDDIRHHVYSFSPAKKFELPLYKGTQAPPVTFDKPGIVVLGCNIHDWMLGYIDVLETPYFDTTAADGRGRIGNVPPGTYDIQVWHPRLLEQGSSKRQRVTVATGKGDPVEFVVSLKAHVRPRRAPSGMGDKYR